ncbi:Isoprenoid synthase domain containing protein [Amanita muscaria]
MTTNSTQFILPDLFAHLPYPLRINPQCEEQSRASNSWLSDGVGFSEERRTTFVKAKFGLLVSMCYPDTDAYHLRLLMDYINWAFVMDDSGDEVSEEAFKVALKSSLAAMRDPVNYQTDEKAGLLTKSWFGRFAQRADPSILKRFIDYMGLTLQAIHQEVEDRAAGHNPNLEVYIACCRHTSGANTFYPWYEFCGGYVLPENVLKHEVIKSLEEASNDYSAWINDLFSYNKEISKGLGYNMVAIVMRENRLSLQEAVNEVGERCNSCVDRFERDRKRLPSWGPEIDGHVAKYVMSLQDWMTGNLYWSFESERYFENEGTEIRKNRVVRCQPLP